MSIIESRKTKQLPPTKVTEQMEGDIRQIANFEGVSVATIQRSAYRMFIQQYMMQRTLNGKGAIISNKKTAQNENDET